MRSAGILAFLTAFGALICAGACGGSDRSFAGAPPEGGTGDPGTNEAGAFNEAAVFTEGGVGPTGSSKTCEGAAEARSYIGCDYWPTVLANNVWEVFDYAVVVANGQDVEAEVTVTGGAASSTKKVKVPPGGLTKIYLPWVSDLKGQQSGVCGDAKSMSSSVVAKNGAYHLVSSVPVSVFQFNALEYKGEGGESGKSWASCPGNQPCPSNLFLPVGCFSFSNDASLLLPSTAWTGNYRVTGQKGLGTETNGVGSYFAVTASADGTNVTVKLPDQQNVLGVAGVSGTTGSLTFSLDAGDVAEIVALAGDNHDLSGALVKADKPVQVLAGTPCSIAGAQGTGVTCDHIEETVYPAETLGKHYFVAPPTSPGGTVVGHVVRFYGNVDGTKLSYKPSAPLGCPTTLKAGQVRECDGTVDKAFEVTGDHEFAVGTFMLSGIYQDPNAEKNGQPAKGDPSMSVATAVEQYRTKYIFLAPDDYDENWVDLVVPDGVAVTVDGSALTETAVPIAGGFGVIRHQLTSGANGAHTVSADQPVGIQVMGFGQYTAYHYPGGLDLNVIAPPPVK